MQPSNCLGVRNFQTQGSRMFLRSCSQRENCSLPVKKKNKVKKYRGNTVEEIEVVKRNTEENKLSRERAAASISQSGLDKRKYQILFSNKSMQIIKMVLLKLLVKSDTSWRY